MNVILAVLGFVALLVGAGTIYQRTGRAGDARKYPPLGRVIDSWHVYSRGEGVPPVVLEAGIAATSLSWQLVQPELAKCAQTVSYDRAGLGWSGASDQPRTIWNVAEELRILMDRAGISKPRILVAHSYGALVVIAYALRHASDVSGLVLVDPVPTCEWAQPSDSHARMLRRAILLSKRGALLAKLGVVRLALSLLAAGSLRLPK
ncbi:MAG TPA: alpha/beta fold hydrolase, partial [Bryobacteraceae bacterium]